MTSQNKKLLQGAADYHAAGLANSFAPDQIGRSADNSHLEYDWIMGAQKVNLIYLEGRRRRESELKRREG
ncbi:hypothetical protein N7537_002762 [Penicillium hordei]|uniref:Uncharacterized protein n=1 Tax=Penicillium hordei TaxID=40994 RepID=A0AAD6EIG0_9EURO|nr:uncharacterized protein N7537_002762 [Penicillium hordei]KAJ5617648.1 hypothetical protein N7537_002762 [Penicillium hordei]